MSLLKIGAYIQVAPWVYVVTEDRHVRMGSPLGVHTVRKRWGLDFALKDSRGWVTHKCLGLLL
jgi:hypothetical protein